MSGLETAALAAVGAWLFILSLAMVLLVRQVSLVSAWAQNQAQSPGGSQDGLTIGLPIPDEAIDLLPEATDQLAYVWFLGGDCQPCREFAADAARADEVVNMKGKHPIVAAVTGTTEQVSDFAQLLPDWVRIIGGDDAAGLNKEFKVLQTPMVYELDRGNVTGRAVAGYGVSDFLNLVIAHEHTDAEEYAGPPAAESQVVLETVTHRGGDNGN